MVVLRQCVSLPAAFSSRSILPAAEWMNSSSLHRRGFQSAVCCTNPRLARNRPSPAKRNVSPKKPPPPAISVSTSKLAPNVYRDFSDGEDETGDESNVIHLKPAAAKQPKYQRKQLRFSDSEDDEEEVDEDEDDDEDEDEEEDEEEGDDINPLAPASRKGMISIPMEPDARGILYEKYVPEHLEGKPTRQLFGSNIHIRAHTSKVLVNRVEFIKSSPSISDCPKDGFPEFAFIGRSNVGKSSIVNLLVERKKLALVSKKPGKTQLINHFLVDRHYYLVDLPGYGYAKAPKKIVVDWNESTKDFFLKRKTLVMVIQLIDSSIPPQQVDIDCTTWLKTQNIPMTLGFTKCDRRKKKKKGGRHPVENITEYLQQLRLISTQTFPWILTSCVTGQGRDELMLHIDEYKRFWNT